MIKFLKERLKKFLIPIVEELIKTEVNKRVDERMESRYKVLIEGDNEVSRHWREKLSLYLANKFPEDFEILGERRIRHKDDLILF